MSPAPAYYNVDRVRYGPQLPGGLVSYLLMSIETHIMNTLTFIKDKGLLDLNPTPEDLAEVTTTFLEEQRKENESRTGEIEYCNLDFITDPGNVTQGGAVMDRTRGSFILEKAVVTGAVLEGQGDEQVGCKCGVHAPGGAFVAGAIADLLFCSVHGVLPPHRLAPLNYQSGLKLN